MSHLKKSCNSIRDLSLHILTTLVFACAPQGVLAQLPTIELTSLSQQIYQTASISNVRVVSGTQLDEITALTFSTPGIKAELQTGEPRLLEDVRQPKYGQFQITISPDVRPGLYEARAVGRFGLSNPVPFIVTSSPVRPTEQEHNQSDKAVELSLLQIEVDQFRPQQRNYFRIQLAANQPLHLVAFAKRLNSQALIAMTLIDPAGREIARSRAIGDFPAEIRLNAPIEGEYKLVTYDFLFQGGENHFYALQATSAQDSATKPELLELLNPDIRQLEKIASNQELNVKEEIPKIFDNPASVFATSLLRNKPASTPQPDGSYQVPFSIIGKLPPDSRPVSFDFQASAGQALWLQVYSSQLSQLTDPRIILYKVTKDGEKEQLQQILEQDDATNLGSPALRIKLTDPSIRFQAPEAARYRIMLLDNQTGERPSSASEFLLSVREPQPTFELVAHTAFPTNNAAQARPLGSNLLRGGTEAIQVIVARQDGFDEAIELRAKDLPSGVTCTPAIVPRGTNEGTLILTAAEDAPDWNGSLQILGRSLGSGVEKLAIPAATMQGSRPTHTAIDASLAQELALHVNARDLAPTLVSSSETSLAMARGGKLPIVFKVARRAGGNGKCTLRPQQLPPKCTLGEIGIEGDKAEATGEMQIAADAPTGEYSFWVQYETKVKFRQRPEAVAREEAYIAKLKSAVEDPAQAARKAEFEAAMKTATDALEPLKQATAEKEYNLFLPSSLIRVRVTETPFEFPEPQPIATKPGQTTKLNLNLKRLFGFADEVKVEVDATPLAGLTVPPAQFAASAESVDLEFKIPDQAQPTEVSLPIKLSYKFNGKDMNHTIPLKLTVQSP